MAARGVVLLVPLGVLLLTGAASAQSFTPQAFTGTRTVSLQIDDDEFVWDRWASSGGGTPHPRYAPNMNQRRRLLANSYVTSISIQFDKIRLNETYVGGLNDYVALGWYGGSASMRTGLMWSAGTWWPVSAAAPAGIVNSLQNPGIQLRFRTGPSAPSASAYDESEQSGFRTSNIALTSTGTRGNTSIPTLAAHERVTGILQPNDDVIHMRLPALSTPVTVAAWQQTPSFGVRVWARCNGLPSASAFAAMDYTIPTASGAGEEGAFIELPVCSGNWFVSLTNVSTTSQVVHLTFGSHYTGRVYQAPQERIGFAYNASGADIAATQAAFQEAAWRLYGATGGGYMLKSFEFYNNTECLTALAQKCGGGICRFCIRPPGDGCTISWWNGLGQVFVCNQSKSDPDVLTHEMGHVYIGLRDNYHTASPSCPGNPTTFYLCGHSIMSDSYDNKNVFCSLLGHRTNQVDWRGFSLPLPVGALPAVIDGPVAYDCSGGSYWTNHSDEWSALSGAHVPTTHPSDWSPDNYAYQHFRRRDILGRPIPKY